MMTFSEPVDSPIRRLDPRVKMLWMILLSLVVFGLSTPESMGVVFLVAMLPVWMLSRSVRYMVKFSVGIIGFLIFLAFFLFITAWFTGKEVFAPDTIRYITGELLRFYLMITSAVLLFRTMDFAELSAAIRSAGSERLPKSWNVAVEMTAFVLGTAFQMVPILAEEMKTIITVQRARGIGVMEGSKRQQIRKLSRMALPLFFRTMEVAKHSAIALKTSGYNPLVPRSRFRVLRLTRVDKFAVALLLILGIPALLFPFIV